MGKMKKFRDTIHGYIEIPEEIVSEIIDTELFQRLRCIEQTSMRSLYPAARHDRFIHSLGVYWLGEKAVNGFYNNFRGQGILSDELDENWWDKQKLLFSLACLLHDCAHAPFSHTLEDFYVLRKRKLTKEECKRYGLNEGTVMSELALLLLDACEEDEEFKQDFLQIDSKGNIEDMCGAPHEMMSAYCVLNEYKGAIKNVFSRLLNIEINADDIIHIVRMIIGCQYKNTNMVKSIQNCIISMLNSSSIDVDGLDYIVRDSYMSGIDNFSIDYQRILESFAPIPVKVYQEEKLKKEKIDGVWLKGSCFEIGELCAKEIFGKLVIEKINSADMDGINGKDCKIIRDAKICSTESENKVQVDGIYSGVLALKESCRICSGTFTGKINGKKICSEENKDSNDKGFEFVLGYNKNCLSVIQSVVEARNHEYLWVYTHPKVLYCSNYLQRELLRDSAKYICCQMMNTGWKKEKLIFNCDECKCIRKNQSSGGQETKIKAFEEEDIILYVLGFDSFFKERALKGTLPKKVQNKLKKEGFVFYRTNDDDLLSLFKRIYRENKDRGELKSDKIDREFAEFFSRKHRVPLWKSFVEYDSFVEKGNYEGETRGIIDGFCRSVVSSASIYQSSYAALSVERQKIFADNEYGNVLIVKSAAKTKALNPDDTFIHFKRQTLRLRDVFGNSNQKDKITKEFYYIFVDRGGKIDQDGFLDVILKEKKKE